MKETDKFGTEPLGKLLKEQALPASIGILIMSLYGIIDTIFVGHFVGYEGIGAITVVLPITFLIASIGMAIGVGGASVISRALGAKLFDKALLTFGNQITLTMGLALVFVLFGFIFNEQILALFGGKGTILAPALTYFNIVLIGIPFLAWSMMSNNVIRAEGFPKVAMYVMIIPAIVNVILDPIFIVVFDMGIAGAAWATTLSYLMSALFTIYHFTHGKSQLVPKWLHFKLNKPLVKEISSLGSVTFARQGVISILAIVLNNSLFHYGGELGLSVYGIVSRVLMFANFPVLGITQGFVPIAGYSYGARLKKRLVKVIRLAVIWSSLFSLVIFTLLMLFAPSIVTFFTVDKELITAAIQPMRIVFLATPLLSVSLIISALYQSTGHAKPALLLALTKQGFFLIPLVVILPLIFGINGIWMAFPLADIGAAAICWWYYKKNGIQYRETTPPNDLAYL